MLTFHTWAFKCKITITQTKIIKCRVISGTLKAWEDSKSSDPEFTPRMTQAVRILPKHQAVARRFQEPKLQGHQLTLHLDCDLVQFGARKCQGLRFTFPFLCPLPRGLFNSLFIRLTFACSNNSPGTWIILRHRMSHRVLSCFHNLRGWLSALITWKTPGMCRVISDFNFNHAWRDRSICLYWPVFKMHTVTVKEI